MTRFVALLAAASLTACGPLVIGTTEPSGYREDHTDDVVLLSMVGVGLIAMMVAIAVGHDHDDAKPKAAPPIAPRARPADPNTMYYAPMPPLADEGEQLRLQRMYVQGLVLARAGRCEGAQALGRQIARSSPDYFMTYAAEPLIADCTRRLAPGGL